MNRLYRNILIARGSDELLTLDGKVSNQKLVRDDVVFAQGLDRDQALHKAVKRMEVERRDAAQRVSEICEEDLHA